MKNLAAEMTRFGVSCFDLQNIIGCSDRTIRNKLNGITEFSVSEAMTVRDIYFPSMRIEYLFADDNPKPTSTNQ